MPDSKTTPPAISVIVPVLGEAEGINDLIARLHALDDDRTVEIIVVDGDPEKSTVKTITDRRVATEVCEPGRASQMNRGAALANSDVLLFLHADTFLPINAFSRIASALLDREYVAGCFDLGIRSDQALFRITERYAALRTRVTRIPFGDQAIFIRRDYFERIGGFADIPLMEDVDLMRRIRGRGDVICIIPEKVSTSARRWEREGVLFTTLRNWALQALYCLGVSPERLARFYRQRTS
ncbi:MAG: TIGR04283 family arsenosugar biosynthesis glycosyltransferase [Nitrospirota bacterium]